MPKTKKKQFEKLPFAIRGELRMACALKAYSHLKQGKGKTIMQQHDSMFAYFHGKPTTHPSQIKLLAEGSTSQYRELYESIQNVATSKKDDSVTTTELLLKKSLHRDPVRTFRAGKVINYLDLEKKAINGSLLVTGRTLLAMAKKGAKFFRKANSYAEQKWNMKKGEPQESGTTIEDVLIFVRQSMYEYVNNNKSEMSGDEEDNDDTNNDENDDSGSSKSDSSVGEVEAPDSYIFPGYMAFVAWGPFAEPNDRLLLFLTQDAPKNMAMGRAAKRKADMELNESERASDSGNNRGFSTDQRISIEGLYLQKKIQLQQSAEASMISLIAHERAISRQIDSAERRAEMRCKKYDATNMHWKIVDALLKKQASITTKMEVNTASLENNDDMNGVSIVSDFMNQKSPSKGSKNAANCNNQSVGNLDGSKVTNLESDDSDDSLNVNIIKVTEDMTKKDNEKDVST